MNQHLEHKTKTLRTDKLQNLSARDNGIERAILYCLLHSGQARESIGKIDEVDFEIVENRDLFLKLQSHIKNCDIFDLLTVPGEIKTNKSFLDLFGQDNILVSNFPVYLEGLKEYSARRKFEKIAYDITVMTQQGDNPLEIKSKAIKKIEEIDIRLDKKIMCISEVDLALDEYYEKEDTKVIKTGFGKLDMQIGGLYKGSLYAIGGVPAVGKTTYILNIINNICRQGHKVLMVSLEMPYREVEGKLISELSGISTSRIRNFDNEKDEKIVDKIKEARTEIYKYQLYFIGSNGLYTYEIEEAIKNLGEVDIVFVDYLQRVNTKEGKDRYEKISKISSELKTLATKYDIPVVAIASLNRAYSERANKEPALSDFRDSGNIEYDLDVALLLYREAQYKEDAPIDKAKVIISKNRYGASNISINLKFEPERSKFYEREEHSAEEKARKDIYD